MEKINILELLKDCPKGMELDCTMWDNVTLFCAADSGAYPIKIETPDGFVLLDKYGGYSSNELAKCVIFPKGKTTWEGFQIPFKDGDILITDSGSSFILKKINNSKIYGCYCAVRHDGEFVIGSNHWTSNYNLQLATEEEKQKLFSAIKANGYKWNAETKTLEKLVEPKFKVGDDIREKNKHEVFLVSEVCDNHYHLDEKDISLPFHKQDDWELVPSKFDISTLKPFDKVLVRDSNLREWIISFFSHCNGLELYKYICISGVYSQCIPYEGNEHLFGKTDDCDEFYKTWG